MKRESGNGEKTTRTGDETDRWDRSLPGPIAHTGKERGYLDGR